MSEYVFRYANGYGCDMTDLMDGGRVTVGEYFASDATDHYGTLHEEIVRCRDCKHLFVPQWDEILAAEFGAPPIVCERTGDMDDIEPDGFCKWGERRGDAE